MGELPFVLAGPIVRRVERENCSIWLALRDAATVDVRLYRGRDKVAAAVSGEVASGIASTIQVLPRLHVVVVSVDTSAQPLDAGETYSYDVHFTVGTTRTRLVDHGLLGVARPPGVSSAAPLHRPLGFDGGVLPTLLLPPDRLEDVRIVHASCRRAGAGTMDAFAAVADLFGPQENRPHQLFLTGDQIYADDVASPLMEMVIALGAELMNNGHQVVPLRRSSGDPLERVPGDRTNFPPGRRGQVINDIAKFTTTDSTSHLLTLPEFAAMYLMAWSPRVWAAVPSFTTTFAVPAGPSPWWLTQPWRCPDPPMSPAAWSGLVAHEDRAPERVSFDRTAKEIGRWGVAASEVAQVLANTATYMVFDDHEITDDWNLNRRWSSRVFTNETGRSIVRNGLLAYGLFQGWGNDPAAYAAGTNGSRVLDAAKDVVSPRPERAEAAEKALDRLFGFDEDEPAAPGPHRMRWDYQVDAPAHRVVVLDTRNWRTTDGSLTGPPNLLGNMLDEQLPAGPDLGGRKVLVVVSPAPVIGPTVIDRVGQSLAQLAVDGWRAYSGAERAHPESVAEARRRRDGCVELDPPGNEKYDLEGWTANDEAFEALLARIATYPRVVALSGDVHYAATLTLDYWVRNATSPARLVQCTSSPAKNLFKDTVLALMRSIGNLDRAQQVGVERLGWAEPPDDVVVAPGASLSVARRARRRRTPVLLPTAPWPEGTKLPTARDQGPDWRWRMSAVAMEEPLDEAVRPAPIDEKAEDEANPAIDRLGFVAAAHRQRLRDNKDPRRIIVMLPNFGLVRFRGGSDGGEAPTGFDVVHEIFTTDRPDGFHAARAAGAPEPPMRTTFRPFTRHVVPLEPVAAEPPTIRSSHA